ncbi:MAG: copper transporter [Nostocoides sp.]|uniref:copper transporter n=1 Tax=Nostocoides sp. TaxID=1917966 RepID=UPI002CA90E4C|nr:copper transporter [Tetrasphaera sp.]
MIDFRYHLVSLTSVLIALAVGIVLGAGPLKEGISESLGQQVEQLREDKDTLRAQLDSSQGIVQAQESFAAAQLTRIVSGQLTDRVAAVVTLPGVDDALVKRTEDTIAAAGATLLGPVAVTTAWTDSSEAARSERSALAAVLAQSLGMEDASADLDAVLATLIAVPRTADGESGPAAPTDAARISAWDTLADAGLVTGTFPTIRASLVAVISAPATPASVASASAGVDPLPALADLALALDQSADGTVIVGDLDPAVTDSDSLVSAARDSSAVRQQVSTVDAANTAMGQAASILALVEQLAGRSGQYGMAAGAGSPFPAGG